MLVGELLHFLLTSVVYALIAITIILVSLSCFICELMLRPSWYRHKTYGHRNRKISAGGVLPKTILGDANYTWRISEQVDGLGTPLSDLNLDFKCVEIPLLQAGMPDNKILRGWLIDGRSRQSHDSSASFFGNTCIVGIHGGGRDRRQWLRHLPVFHKLGCAFLTVDCEEHGLSDGKGRRVGWVTYEQIDALSAAYFAKFILKYEKVILLGTSMGGAGVIMAGGFGLPNRNILDKSLLNVKQSFDGIIAENPLATRANLVCHLVNYGIQKVLGLSLGRIVAAVVWPPVYIMIMLSTNAYKFGEPIDAVRQIKGKPVLIMHGTADELVTWEQGKALYDAANEPKLLYLVKGATHTATFNADPVKWAHQINKFLLLVHNVNATPLQ